ncbi:high mobility group B protein 6 [Cocos nucifera]|uniref:High mobility group B protein 6 n=1 Tax=Cocos nucifera TaxID=13894 RepID=A0A8K0I6V6_COCNU|nr:high mobility group B protein 6 [Cocos nucifera]
METPAAGTPGTRSLPRRKPLQSKNSNASPAPASPPKPKPIQISPLIKGDTDKENRPIHVAEIGPLEASLAEELEAIRRRRERLRVERERTERMLRERDRVLEKAIREWERRGREQRRVELELQRLTRLKELEASCMRFTPVKSLRAREEEKRSAEAQSQGLNRAAQDNEATESLSSQGKAAEN